MRASVFIDSRRAAVGVGNVAAVVGVDGSRAIVTCSQIEEQTFTTPTLTEWHAMAEDNGTLGCLVTFTAVTAGSPCRVRFHLIDSETYKTAFSSPDQNTPHTGTLTVTGTLNRGKWYDLKWSWSSGNESVTQELVLADAVYIPADGEGDQLSEG